MLTTKPGPKPKPIADRFWPKVDLNGPIPEARPDLGPCWIWTASRTSSGYGQLACRPGPPQRAHRIAYVLIVGPIPEGLELDHVCRVRACVNPAHLEPVTNIENIMRGESVPARNARKTECAHGHPFDAENTRTRERGGRRRSRECRTCIS